MTKSVENFAAKPKDVCDAMEGTISALYDSFTKREFLNLTLGRSALSGAMDAMETSMSQEDLGSKTGCRLRDFAGGILMSKAGATKAQVAGLTNQEIANFLETLRETRDPSSVKDAIAMTVEDRAVKG